MNYTVAELLDKLSILSVKLELDPPNQALLHQFASIEKNLPQLSFRVQVLYAKLYYINKAIFQCVFFIENTEDINGAGITAKVCQSLNLDRASIKKEIDSSFGVQEESLEIKI